MDTKSTAGKKLLNLTDMAKALSIQFNTKVLRQSLQNAITTGVLPSYRVNGMHHVDIAETLRWYKNRGKPGNRSKQGGWQDQSKELYIRRLEEIEAQKLGHGRKFEWNFKGGTKTLGEFQINRHFRIGIDFVSPTLQADPVAEPERRKQELKGAIAQLRKVEKVLNAAEIPAKVSDDPKDFDEVNWFIRYDQMVGGTIISPPLKGHNGLYYVRLVLRALKEGGIQVDENEGSFHVHIDITDFDVARMRRLIILYHFFEREIDTFMPIMRRGNNNKMLRSLRVGYIGEVAKAEKFTRLIRVLRLEQGKFVADQRYKLNPSDIFRMGTMEFKHQGSTLSVKRAIMWIRMCMAMVEESGRYKNSLIEDATPSFDLLYEVLYLENDWISYFNQERMRIAQEVHEKRAEQKRKQKQIAMRLPEWIDLYDADPEGTYDLMKQEFLDIGFIDREAGAKADVMRARILRELNDFGKLTRTHE